MQFAQACSENGTKLKQIELLRTSPCKRVVFILAGLSEILTPPQSERERSAFFRQNFLDY
jgi:hypothetical protein